MSTSHVLAELAYWQQTGIRVGVGLAAVLLVAGALVYMHLFKAVSFMQSRLGPMEAGPYGSLQLLAEVGKHLQKEDIFPRKADRFVFGAAPFVVLASTFLLVRRSAGRPRPLVRRQRTRNLLGSGGVVGFGTRRSDGGLGVGQQVLATRRPASDGSTHRL